MAAEVTKRVQGGFSLDSERSLKIRCFKLTKGKGKPEQKRLEVLLGDVVKTDLPVRTLHPFLSFERTDL